MEWTKSDAAFLKRFLESDTGQKVKTQFKAAEPVMDAKTLEARALQAAEFAQYRKDKDLIKNLLSYEPEPKKKDRFIDMEGLNVQS